MALLLPSTHIMCNTTEQPQLSELSISASERGTSPSIIPVVRPNAYSESTVWMATYMTAYLRPTSPTWPWPGFSKKFRRECPLLRGVSFQRNYQKHPLEKVEITLFIFLHYWGESRDRKGRYAPPRSFPAHLFPSVFPSPPLPARLVHQLFCFKLL